MNDDDFRGSGVHHGGVDHHDDVDQSVMGHNTSNVNNESDSEKGCITPVNIRQLINANMPGINNFELDYKTKKKKIEQITLVAQIVKFTDEVERRKLNLFMDDGTGRMSVILYGINTAQRFEPTGGVIESGLFLRIYGILNTDTKTGTRYIVGTSLTVVTDMNEFTAHLLDVIVASLHCQFGSLIGRTVPKVQQESNHLEHQYTEQHYADHTHDNAGGVVEQGKPLAVLIYEAVTRKPGISFHEIVALTGADFDETVSAFEVLFMNGNLGYAADTTERYVLGPNKLMY